MLLVLQLALTALAAAPPAADPGPGVSQELARHRARTISDLRYELRLEIPTERAAPIRGRETIRFALADAAAPVVLDFQQPAERVIAVRRPGGAALPHRVVEDHIVVEAGALAAGENAVEVEFLAGDGSLNRNDDYLYTLFVPDRASVAVPLFDQPDLKARYTLTLEIPADWVAVANGAELRRTVKAGRAEIAFAETRPIPSYLFAFAAGRWQVETAERNGRTYRMLHRETDRAKLARNRDAIFDLQAAALEWMEEYTGIDYPFGKYDFVAVPSFQYGGMEHPGAVLYRASSLLLDETATRSQELGRASLIAHETAHMWFGDLVTMRWFDDVWTKEVFANFMAAKIVNPSFPDVDHELRFLLAHYPAAYEVDRTAGANPIRQPLDNLQEAGSLYGAIIYQKAPIVMRQLEAIVGEASFREGLREYLGGFAFANATWPDLVGILDRRSPLDLAAWSRVWVEEPGRPAVAAELRAGGGRIARLELVQQDPAGAGRLWPQRLDVLLGYADSVASVPVFLEGERTVVEGAAGRPAPEWVLLGGIGYGRLQADPATRRWLLARLPEIGDARVRGLAWITLWDALLEGDVAPADLLDLAERALPAESDELNTSRVLGYAAEAFWRFLPAAGRERRAAALEALLWRGVEQAPTPRLKATWFDAYRRVALTPAGVERLARLWRRELEVPGLTLSESDETALAAALALREYPGWDRVLAEQQARIENPDRRERFAFVRPALDADTAVRNGFFGSLARRENRAHEPWVLEALGYLNHPLRAAQAERYIVPALELLPEIQRTGDIFFPKSWLDALLGGHASPTAAAAVRGFLDGAALPARLRGKLLQSADPLFRAAAIRERAGTGATED